MTKRPRTTASARIRVADWADQTKSAIVAELPAAVAYRTSGADDGVQQQVLELAANGKKLTVAHVKALIDGRPLPDESACCGTEGHGKFDESSTGRSREPAEGVSAACDGPKGLAAARLLIEKLRQAFDDHQIADLLELWQRASPDDLHKELSGKRAAETRRRNAALPLGR